MQWNVGGESKYGSTIKTGGRSSDEGTLCKYGQENMKEKRE